MNEEGTSGSKKGNINTPLHGSLKWGMLGVWRLHWFKWSAACFFCRICSGNKLPSCNKDLQTTLLPEISRILRNVGCLYTWSNLDEPVVLDEDGVTGQVAMDDRRVTWVEITAEKKKKTSTYENTNFFRKWVVFIVSALFFAFLLLGNHITFGIMCEKGRPTWEQTGSVCTIASKPVGPYTLSEHLTGWFPLWSNYYLHMWSYKQYIC